MQRVKGTNDLADLDEDVRHTVLSEYFENLARLHSLAVGDDATVEVGLP